MNRATNFVNPGGNRKWKTVALPAEHGSWGFVGEPLLLGLLTAPSLSGVFMALGLFGAFLARWPLKVAIQSGRQGRAQRAQLARRFAYAFATIAILGFGISIWLTGWRPLLPFLLGLPFALIFLYYDFANKSRSWQAELAAPAAFAVGASAIYMTAGGSFGPALGLWGVLVARAVPSILYIRARLRLDKGKSPSPGPALLAHGIAVVGVGLLAVANGGYWPAVGIIFLLLLRAAFGLSRFRRSVAVKWIGIGELLWGVLVVISVWLGLMMPLA
ncbi:MAG: YwiC-like family protein [Ardenticatenaceae bacterium]|nr:YwiC-like family protein [Ardenticatenaceae bacterium]